MTHLYHNDLPISLRALNIFIAFSVSIKAFNSANRLKDILTSSLFNN